MLISPWRSPSSPPEDLKNPSSSLLLGRRLRPFVAIFAAATLDYDRLPPPLHRTRVVEQGDKIRLPLDPSLLRAATRTDGLDDDEAGVYLAILSKRSLGGPVRLGWCRIPPVDVLDSIRSPSALRRLSYALRDPRHGGRSHGVINIAVRFLGQDVDRILAPPLSRPLLDEPGWCRVAIGIPVAAFAPPVDESHALVVLEADKGKEETDADGRGYADGARDELGEPSTEDTSGDDQEDEALEEDDSEGSTVREVVGAMEADDSVGEVGVGAHVGGQRQRQKNLEEHVMLFLFENRKAELKLLPLARCSRLSPGCRTLVRQRKPPKPESAAKPTSFPAGATSVSSVTVNHASRTTLSSSGAGAAPQIECLPRHARPRATGALPAQAPGNMPPTPTRQRVLLVLSATAPPLLPIRAPCVGPLLLLVPHVDDHPTAVAPLVVDALMRRRSGIDLLSHSRFSSLCPALLSDRFLIRRPRKMASHIVGYPRMGPKRELKFALESFWDGKSSADDLQKVATDLRCSIWKQMADVGIKYIPSNTFSYYDQVLDTTAMLGAVPERYNYTGGEIGFDVFFSMARGNASVPAMEMTKWFDTNYHFIVPELGPNTKFSYSSHKAVSEYKEAKALGIETVPVLIGPVTYLLLSKPAKGVEKSFSPLSLLGSILPIYKEVIAELKAAGASWIQFDEPTLVMDLQSHQLEAFTNAYAELESSVSGLNVLIETYFADIPAETYKTITALKGVSGFGFDLVRGTQTIDLIKAGFPAGKYLFAGVVDGRNIWANDLASSLSTLQALEAIVGKDKLVVSTSCSLMHTAVDLVNETKLDNEIKSWLAFAAQKVVEVNALAKALAGQKDEAFFSANAAAQSSRKSSPRVTNEEVQKAAADLRGSDHRRATNVSARLDAQQKKLNLPILPTTTIGSFPQTMDLRRVRREYKANKISEEVYVNSIKEEISKVVKLQEELDIDVLVHGEPERNDMVEYFGEQLSGFAFTVNGWVQSYGSRCVKPPVIYGDVSRPKAMTVFWSKMAQSMTARPMKGMLTGPVTILNWSFVRNDQPRFETCYQIALAIKKEVEDLEAAGIQVIQIDEAALREGLPLRKSEQAFYLDWAVHSFRITNCGVQDTTQIHTHMCYSNFNDIIHSIINMDADVITIENSRSDEKLLSVFREGVKYGAGIGPGVYDIHSPRIPSMEEIADRINKMLAVLETNILWVNPDCGLKTRKYGEVKPALTNMVDAAKLLRTQLASTK
ncbi:5-methyltetrahydropteroyltriglutamate--homocysteine methyltransferase 1 [Canna indica]|uniref:5-methyltetrahydropteroyltriglutamate--homocysteine S-methyltransferase n=1 Tax=Canna indica TaxID=4628 RepID=A0AAQ3Q854_9LILI|nr:5-methyltetrahydropteroyltriglutamate--homocysteine methyltransferase 1 [Canna indica]